MKDAGEERAGTRRRGGAKMKNPVIHGRWRRGRQARRKGDVSTVSVAGGATRREHYHTLPRCDSQNCNTLVVLESREIMARYLALETFKNLVVRSTIE